MMDETQEKILEAMEEDEMTVFYPEMEEWDELSDKALLEKPLNCGVKP